MKIFVDENIPLISVNTLRDMGHDVFDIRGSQEQGMADSSLWHLAQSDQRLLITTDKGFTQYRNETHAGVLIIRLRQPNRRRIHERVLWAIEQFRPDEWPGLLVVVRDATQSIWRSTNE
ncbi:MAG: DUF5615 family PIN-like protein [Chloroflexota bacterium]